MIKLSWTSRSLNLYLMTKSAATVWRACLKRVQDLPPCPPNVIEPVYASFMFLTHCMVRAKFL